jgi:hypothetical protein
MKTLFFIFFVITTRSLADEVVPDSPAEMTVSGIRQWQKDGGMSQYGWIKEYSEDLNGDKQPEIFLAVGGFGRGADYAVFTEDQSSWKFIGYTSFGNLLIRVLPAKKENWHDFVAICPSGRGGVVETSYSWDGKTYVEKQSKEIPMEWKDGEYVPEDNSNSGQKAGVNGDQAR